MASPNMALCSAVFAVLLVPVTCALQQADTAIVAATITASKLAESTVPAHGETSLPSSLASSLQPPSSSSDSSFPDSLFSLSTSPPPPPPRCEARAEWLEQELAQNKLKLDESKKELNLKTAELGREQQQRQVAEKLLLRFEKGQHVFSREGGGDGGAAVPTAERLLLPVAWESSAASTGSKIDRYQSEEVEALQAAGPFPGAMAIAQQEYKVQQEKVSSSSLSFEAPPSSSVIAARRRLTATIVTNEAGLTAALANGATIELAADILLTSTVTIDGLTNLVIDGKGFKIDGNNTVGCVAISNGATVALMDLTITRGSTGNGGGLAITGSTTVVTMDLCTISSNYAASTGGGVSIDAATVAMTSCIISTNAATTNVGGGLVVQTSATATLTSCLVSQNNAVGAAGLALNTPSTAKLVGCSFVGNVALNPTLGNDVGNNDATLEFYSLCSSDTAFAGTGFLACAGCTGLEPADLSDTSSCSTCTGLTPFACCGATACSASASTCSATELEICPNPTPQPTITVAPTSSPSLPPTLVPSSPPTLLPTSNPSPAPTPIPTLYPTPLPTNNPSLVPTAYCGAGSFLNEATGACVLCSVGTYTDNSTAPFPTKCRTCAAGTFAKEQGTSACESCPAGKMSSPDRSFCQDCSAGEYIKDAKGCVGCESGRYAPQPLSGACLLCGAGSFTNNATKATTCSPCNAGSFSPGFTSSCTLCAVGSASVSGQSACVLCEAGKYADAEGSSTCVACAAGFAVAFEGATSCSECSSGQFQIRSGESSCDPCEGGKFSSESASTACSECPRGYSSVEGSFSCHGQADEGYFLYQGEATECPKNSVCDGATLMPRPNRGYWVDRRNLKFSNDIYKCPRKTCSSKTTTTTSRRRLIDGSTGDDESCWDTTAYESNDCDSDNLLCEKGSLGALCGACESTFIYSSVDRICVPCDVSQKRLIIILSTAAGLVLVAAGLHFSGALERIPSLLAGFGAFDSGALRVAWANYQIIQSASRNIDVSFPSPFKEMMSALSIFSFDFLSLECFFAKPDHFLSVYIWSAVPFILVALLVLNHYIGVHYSSVFGSVIPTTSTLTYRLLLLGYLVLPPVSLKLLQSLDCVTIADKSYLRIDTSIDCDSNDFTTFKIIDGLIIAVYLSTPIVWFALLFQERSRLNPPVSSRADQHPQEALEQLLAVRDADTTLRPLRFLFDAYRPAYYYIECLEMYRRVLFVGVLPLLAAASNRRAALGIFFSLCSLGFYGEVAPFLNPSTNILAYVAQYANLLTFGAALAIEVGLDKGMDSFLFGCILVAINVVVVGFIFFASVMKFRRERSMQQWRRALTDEELQVVNAVMTPELSTDDRDTMTPAPSLGGIEMVECGKQTESDKETQDARSVQALKQSLIESKDVKLIKRVGAGAFGEVFKGTVLGQPVAVKTMLTVTEKGVKEFRNEILLTSTLRHPNIVSFVGACWGQELICLVLEWVPRGSLADLLEDKALDLHWGEPLLRLAMDVARGMIYLHGREYFDERDQEHKQCILHRDLKPDNALVTDYTSLKITDFGTSRAKAADDVNMTGVGTPLFCAPEVSRDEPYDEKADVYSFGLTLVDMAADEFITDFIGERWKVAFNKKKFPNPQTLAYNKVLWPIWEGKWRPVSDENPIEYAPGTINDLIFRCTAHDQKSRPSFVEILEFLSGPCMVEVEGEVFGRHPKNDQKVANPEDTPATNTAAATDGYPDDMVNDSEALGSFQRFNPMSTARASIQGGGTVTVSHSTDV